MNIKFKEKVFRLICFIMIFIIFEFLPGSKTTSQAATKTTTTISKPVISLNGGYTGVFHKIYIEADKGCDIYYTTDGSSPTKKSSKYTEPIILRSGKKYTIKAIAYKSNKKSSVASINCYEKQTDLGKKVEKIIKNKIKDDMTVYEKILAIQIYIIENVTYDKTLASVSYTASGALLKNSATCDGYSRAFKLLLNRMNIPCQQVVGYMNDASHAWNLVQIDGEWYHIEPQTLWLPKSGADFGTEYRWNEKTYPSSKKNYFDNVESLVLTKYSTCLFEVINYRRFSLDFKDNLKKITLSDNVTELKKESFAHMPKLETVILSDNLTTIADNAFLDCPKLKYINWPKNITTIGSGAYSHCDSLIQVDIPNTVTTLGQYAFSFCENLEYVTISNNVTRIEKGTFKGCRTLKSIKIPASVTYIETTAIPKSTILYGELGSYTETFALENDYTFLDINSIINVYNDHEIDDPSQYQYIH